MKTIDNLVYYADQWICNLIGYSTGQPTILRRIENKLSENIEITRGECLIIIYLLVTGLVTQLVLFALVVISILTW